MISKVREKEEAIKFRKSGYTYNEILKKLPVAKSSLSLWLKDLPLTEREVNYLRTRKDSNISRGRIKAATANRFNRLEREKAYVEEAKKEFYRKESNSLFLVGVALYWAEGAKRDNSVQFMNSDPEMISIFIRWLEKFENLNRETLNYRLFIHKPYAHENCEKFWANYIGVSSSCFRKTIYKPSGLAIKKRPSYKGCFRVTVPRGTRLLLKIKVWQNMLARKFMRP